MIFFHTLGMLHMCSLITKKSMMANWHNSVRNSVTIGLPLYPSSLKAPNFCLRQGRHVTFLDLCLINTTPQKMTKEKLLSLFIKPPKRMRGLLITSSLISLFFSFTSERKEEKFFPIAWKQLHVNFKTIFSSSHAESQNNHWLVGPLA